MAPRPGMKVLLDGELVGTLHHWTERGGVAGASVHLAPDMSLLAGYRGRRLFTVSHVFVAEADYDRFTFEN